jgi:hypothetical protein
VVGKEDRDRGVPRLELTYGVEGVGPRASLDDAILGAKVPPEVPLDGVEDLRLVVDGQYHWSGHRASPGLSGGTYERHPILQQLRYHGGEVVPGCDR